MRTLAQGALILMACAGSAWAQDEAELEKDVPPESATARPEKATILDQMVDFPLLQPRFTVNLRTYDLGNVVDNVTTQNTWAAGGKVGLVTPEWRETVSVGVAAYASYPLYVRGTVDTTRLVAPDGDALVVPGETYLNLRHAGFNLRLFRQLLEAPYLNDQDSRMIPNVFEAYALTYGSERLYAGAGHVTRMKTRASDEYRPMAEVAGVPGGDSGVSVAGARLRPTQRTSVRGIAIYNWNVFSTAYASAEVGTDLDLRPTCACPASSPRSAA